MAGAITASYRLQFSPDFGFADAMALLPYLEALGVSHVYASPLLKPASGSQHGYDVVDPTRLNPELGEEQEFTELLNGLVERGMGLLLDIVPNHMAASPENPWWQDVLANGPDSDFAHYFDIDWQRGPGGSKIVLPMLGDHIGTVLENGELRLAIDDGGLAVHFYEHRFPVNPTTYDQVLGEVQQALSQHGHDNHPGSEDLDRLIAQARDLDTTQNPTVSSDLARATWRLYHRDFALQASFDHAIERFNGDPGDPGSFDKLEHLLDTQSYRLMFWRRASEEINYRRFFDIGDLVSLRIEDPDVFEAVHTLILELAESDGIDGFRADHVDGLLDPPGYAERLQARLRDVTGRDAETTLLFEKILTGDERLPENWPISGTTGYEFAHRLNALLVDGDGLRRIEDDYRERTGYQGFHSVVLACKASVLDGLFGAEFRALLTGLEHIARRERHHRDLSRSQLGTALRLVMIHLPVYRTYIRDVNITERDRTIIEQTLRDAEAAEPGLEPQVWDFLRSVLFVDSASSAAPERLAWVGYWQQMTGPLMAKGLEDTALYVYTPVLSLNEVGGEPESISADEFHAWNQAVARDWPGTMLTTSTHDTKRSEDVRARLDVLSELPEEWLDHLRRWSDANAGFRQEIDGIPAPDPNEEQLIYQTLLGAWPLESAELPAFRERVKEYLTKALREAKIHTSWLSVNDRYEAAVHEFIDRILGQDPAGEFLSDFAAFQTKISSYGAWNSLTQLMLKLTSPGFPDIYQGNELWDFSLADPDNRRPVDYQLRASSLEDLADAGGEGPARMVQQWRDGRVKLLVTSRILRSRREQPEPYRTGDYIPLEVEGPCREHVLAFARRMEGQWAITVVPRFTTRLVEPERAPVGEEVWGDTTVLLPDGAPSTWVDILTGEERQVSAGTTTIRLADVLTALPVAVLRGV